MVVIIYTRRISMAITGASGTAQLCLNRYEKFVEGYGFDDDILAGWQINRDGTTTDDLLKSVAGDLCQFGGFALHVNYNVFGQITEVNYIPFEQLRLEEFDDAGYVAHILQHIDWKGEKTRNGKKQMVQEKFITRFNVFNPDPSSCDGTDRELRRNRELQGSGALGLSGRKVQLSYANLRLCNNRDKHRRGTWKH